MIQKREEIEIKALANMCIEALDGRVTRNIEFKNGGEVKIPINKDGTLKWFDDSKLIKKDSLKDKAEKYLLNSNGKDIKVCVLSHEDSTNYIASKSKIKIAKVELGNGLTISDPEDEEILTRIPYTGLLNVTIKVLSEIIITYKYASYGISVCLPYSVLF